VKDGSRSGNPRAAAGDRMARARASLRAAERDTLRSLMVGNPRDMVERAWGIRVERDIPIATDRARPGQAGHGDDPQPR